MAGGAFNLGDVFVTFKANVDSVNNAVNDIRTKTASLGDTIENVGQKFSSVGSKFMPFSLAAGAALGLSTKAAMDFNQQMELIATQAGADQKEVDSLKDKVLALAAVVGQSPAELAKGLFFIESAGFRGAAALDILKLAAEGAAVGQTDLASTSNALTSVMNTGIEGAANATEAMGNLNAIVGAGKMHFADLNDAISSGFLITAKTFGVSLESVGAALATLTRSGEPATEVATRLKMAITLMGAPTNQAAKVLTGLGFTMTDAQAATKEMTDALSKAHVTTSQLSDDMRQPNGILVAIQDLKSHLEASGLSADASSAAISRAFGGGRVAGPILALMNDTSQLSATFDQIKQKSGQFGDAWAKQQQQASQKMADFKAQLQVLEVHLGNAFLPVLEKLAKQLGAVAAWFEKLSPHQKQMIVDTLLVVAALGPLLKIIGNVIGVISLLQKGIMLLVSAAQFLIPAILAISAPVWLIIGAIAALLAIGYVLIFHWQTVKRIAGEVWSWIENHIEVLFAVPVIGWLLAVIAIGVKLIGHWQQVVGAAAQLWHEVSGFISRIPQDILGFFANAGSLLFDAGKAIIQGLIHGIESMVGAVTGAISKVADGIKNVAKKILGIFSPSTVFHEIGQNIGQGMANGIDSMVDVVHRAAGGMANATLIASSGSLSSASFAGAGYAPGVTVSLDGAQIIGTVPQDVAEKIGDAIVGKLKRTVRI